MIQTATCIVGLESGGDVYIGADSAGVAGYDLRIRVDEKVFIKGRMIFGFTSSFRMGQILRYSFSPPQQRIGQSDYGYLCGVWVDALIDCLKEKGYAKVHENEVSGGEFVLGFNGRLYSIHEDFQVGSYNTPYVACGCAEKYAMGAMAVLESKHLGPEEKLVRALEIAEQFSSGVQRPFVIKRLEKGGANDPT